MYKYPWSEKQDTRREERRPQPVKVIRPIKIYSEKRGKQQIEYRAIVDQMLKEDPYCEIKVPGVCSHLAEGLHHKKRRGENLLNKKYLVRACNACNGYLEQYPQFALDNGYSISIHKKETV